MSTTPTPLPCPFCGAAPTIVERPDNIDGTEFFYAFACYCGGYSACAHKMAVRKTPEQAKADAIAEWNRRAALTQGAGEAVEPVAQWQERQQKTETEWTDWYAVSKPLHLLLNPDSRSLVQGGIEYQWRPLYPAPPGEGGLWAVNAQGPDDVYPCESRLAALEMANTLNASFIAQQEKDHHEYDPIMRAVVIPWEHSPEEHAAALRLKGTHD